MASWFTGCKADSGAGESEGIDDAEIIAAMNEVLGEVKNLKDDIACYSNGRKLRRGGSQPLTPATRASQQSEETSGEAPPPGRGSLQSTQTGEAPPGRGSLQSIQTAQTRETTGEDGRNPLSPQDTGPLSPSASATPALAGKHPLMKKGKSAASIQGLALPVYIYMYIRRVFDVDTQEQTFGVQLTFRMLWKAPPEEEMPEPGTHGWIPRWKPEYRFRRLMDELSSEENYKVIIYEDVPHIMASYDHIVKLYETMELQHFPVDMQKLGTEIVSLHPQSDVKWEPFPQELVTSTDREERVSRRGSKSSIKSNMSRIAALDTSLMALADFEVVKEIPYTYQLTTIPVENDVGCISVQVNLVRKSGYYVVNVLFITAIIITGSFCAWSVHPADVAARQDVDLNLVLTAVAFKIVLTELLPVVSYITLADIYINIGCLFLCIVTTLHSALPWGKLTGLRLMDNSPLTLPPLASEYEEDLIQMDRLSLRICGGAWFVFNVIYFVLLWCKGRWVYRDCVVESRKMQQQFDDEVRVMLSELSEMPHR